MKYTLVFTIVNSSVLYNIPYSCRKLSTVLDKVIVYYYSCSITTAII